MSKLKDLPCLSELSERRSNLQQPLDPRIKYDEGADKPEN